MEHIQFKPALIKTKSVRDTAVMMDGLAMLRGDGCMAGICGVAGRGKTFTVQAEAAIHDGVYIRAQYIWRGSELEFVQAICRDLGMPSPPNRRGKCWLEIVDQLSGTDRPIFLDEMQRLPKGFLHIALDLADATCCPVILIGEPELKGMMQENKRVWSRTFQFLEFEPISVSDVMFYSAETTGLKLHPDFAGILHKAASGDFRIIKRSMIALLQYVNANGQTAKGQPVITEEMVRIAAQAGLKGKK